MPNEQVSCTGDWILPVVIGSGVLFSLCWNQSELFALFLGEVADGLGGGASFTIFNKSKKIDEYF